MKPASMRTPKHWPPASGEKGNNPGRLRPFRAALRLPQCYHRQKPPLGGFCHRSEKIKKKDMI